MILHSVVVSGAGDSLGACRRKGSSRREERNRSEETVVRIREEQCRKDNTPPWERTLVEAAVTQRAMRTHNRTPFSERTKRNRE